MMGWAEVRGLPQSATRSGMNRRSHVVESLWVVVIESSAVLVNPCSWLRIAGIASLFWIALTKTSC
jgi:hypothetical protein